MVISYKGYIEYNDMPLNEDMPFFRWGAENSTDTSGKQVEYFKVAASASDEAIAIQTVSNTKIVLIESFTGDNDLTVKINGSSDAYTLNPRIVLSEALTSLTVSNADSTNDAAFRVIRLHA